MSSPPPSPSSAPMWRASAPRSVVADFRANCGSCVHCLEGNGNLCLEMGYVGEVSDGGFAEETLLAADRVLRGPPGVTPEIAALSEPLAVALHVRQRLDRPPDQPILIAGGGPSAGCWPCCCARKAWGRSCWSSAMRRAPACWPRSPGSRPSISIRPPLRGGVRPRDRATRSRPLAPSRCCRSWSTAYRPAAGSPW